MYVVFYVLYKKYKHHKCIYVYVVHTYIYIVQCTRHGLIPELARSPGEGNGNQLQYSCLGNPMDRGAWLATVHGVTKQSGTT